MVNMALQSIRCLPHVFFIHSSVGRQLGRFHNLAIVTSAPWSAWTCECFPHMVPLLPSDIYSKLIKLGSMLLLGYWKSSILIFRVAKLVNTPINSAWGSLPPSLWAFLIFFHSPHDNYSDWSEMGLWCNFNLPFLMTKATVHSFFHVFIGHLHFLPTICLAHLPFCWLGCMLFVL